ncbi:hypothetical protein [Streptomyces sp. 900105245]
MGEPRYDVQVPLICRSKQHSLARVLSPGLLGVIGEYGEALLTDQIFPGG